MHLLIIEDDRTIAENLYEYLESRGHQCDYADSLAAASRLLVDQVFDAAVLDRNLPDGDGLALARRLRSEGNSLPLLILTARDTLEDKLVGFDAGADDYLVKPIDLDELAARIRAMARRSAGHASPILRLGDLEIDPAAHQVSLGGAPVELSAREFSLLLALAENAGRAMTRAQLESTLYGWQEEPESNALEVHVHHLRRKLGSDRIRTLRGIGYLMPKF
ncbi:MAG: response regulator [Gammaproteobacteria bacterium]|nr:MAG: response regulator [Gammaproteobacteria bacterium]